MHLQRSLMFGITSGALAFSLAACGSTGATATSTNPSSAKSKPTSSSKTPSSNTPSSSNSSSSAPTSGVAFSLAKLASYTNYAFTYSVAVSGATVTFTGSVHSLTDWRLQTSSPAVTTYDVDGKGYGTVAGLSSVSSETFATPEGIHHLNGQYVNAQALIGMTHVYGEEIRKGGSCTVAGQSGTIYNLGTPKNSYFSIGD